VVPLPERLTRAVRAFSSALGLPELRSLTKAGSAPASYKACWISAGGGRKEKEIQHPSRHHATPRHHHHHHAHTEGRQCSLVVRLVRGSSDGGRPGVRPPMVNAARAHAELVCFSTLGELRRGTIENMPPELASSLCASAAPRE
jgi:hypothetical protein